MTAQHLSKWLMYVFIASIVLLILSAIYLTAPNTLTIVTIIVDVIVLSVEGMKKSHPSIKIAGTLVGIIIISFSLIQTITEYCQINKPLLDDMTAELRNKNKDFLSENTENLEALDSLEAASRLSAYHQSVMDSLYVDKHLRKFFRNKYEKKLNEYSKKEIRAFFGEKKLKKNICDALNWIIDVKKPEFIDLKFKEYNIADSAVAIEQYENENSAGYDHGSLKTVMEGIMEGFLQHIRFKKIITLPRGSNNEIIKINFINE